MSKPPLDYQRLDQSHDERPPVRWQTVVSCVLLAMGMLSGLVALVWPSRRSELISAAISLVIAGVLIYFPYVRT